MRKPRLVRSQQTESPLISVVIPTFNRAAMLSDTLESLANQRLPKNRYEVVVVDDGSEDTTPDVCRDFASRMQLRYLHIENSGISAAKNTGILASRGRILLFFDDDDIADNRLLGEHLKAHEQYAEENIAVLGYTTWAPKLPVTPLMRYVTETGFLFSYGNLHDGQMLDFTYFWGGRSSCKRSFLARNGVFNPQFRTIIEDMELGYRLSQFGLRVVFHRAAVSYMARPLTFEAFCVRCERQGEALFLFSRLHDDPIIEQYCRSGDPFIERRALGTKPEVRWPDVASLFREKVNQAGRLERLLAWGFEPEELDGAEASPQAEAYRLQMRELFASLQNSLSQSEQRASRIVELEAELAEREASFQAELRKLKEDIQELSGSLQRTKIESAARASNLAKQTLQIVKLERQHKAEKAELERRFKAENAELERQLRATGEQLSQHRVELDHLRDRFLKTNRLLHSRSISLAEHERRVYELTNRLRAQLWSTRKLSHLLEDVDKASARLRSSRRWKLANPLTAIEAKLQPAKVSVGYGHLERIVAKYLQWREAHPEIEKIDDEIIKTLTFPAIPKTSAIEPSKSDDNFDGIPSIAETEIPRSAPETLSIPPPVPAAPVESIRFPTHDDVEVSIIVPVYNQFQFTHACLVSLQMAEERPRFEVILVDDCSTDETADLVPRIEGVVYLRNETNCGFIASCNRGADKARGKYLVFLNNDTIVTEGWLSALLDTFTEEPQAGIVGSKLLYPDGRLQEAGAIIWRDASGWNYGKFDDPEKPEYNYLREVDYCSGAALMIPKALFLSLGGFDSQYAPAYYEDTDLSFKVRRDGYKVLYQPLSEIIHYEGATGGTDLSTGTKRHQAINRSKFAETWAVELMTRPVNGDSAFLKQAPPGRKNILLIDHHLPMPEKDSGSLRMFYVLNILHRLGHHVTFVPDNLADIPPYGDELQKRGIEVVYHPYLKSVRDYLASHGSRFDAVVLSRCDFARKHIADVRLHAPRARIVFDTVDLHFLRDSREARLTQDPGAQLKAREKEKQEYALIDEADETWVVSTAEQKLLQEQRPHKTIEVVTNIVEVPGSSTPFSLRQDWLFIGSFQHPPNVDAIIYFVQEIYPLLPENLRRSKFYIIGDKAPPEVIALASENVVVTGLQRDVRPYFDNVKLSIAPLRWGAGVKGKINQSMGLGVPVIATSLAVEGMALTDHEDVLVADEPDDFARALIELYESEELWNRLSENGIRKTRALYSIDAARERLRHLFSEEHITASRKMEIPSPQMHSTNALGTEFRS